MNSKTSKYDVIIVGGGPTGAALGIELGLNDVKTLVLEKHEAPLLSPRAQSLNARSMEFFMRWQLADKLKAKQLLPPDFPIRGVWCSKLNGNTYAVSSSNEQLNDDISPQRGVRIPLYLTEEVLRDQLSQFDSVTFLKQHAVTDVRMENGVVLVEAKNSVDQVVEFQAPYVIACDGANSITRKKADINFEVLSPPQRVINLMFKSLELESLITVEQGFLYYLLANTRPGAIGPVDLKNGIWYAQVRCDGDAETIDQVNIDLLLEEMTGIAFPKEIIQSHFWNMHIQLAESFSKNNCVFLVGDSAHAFVPTGGFGLNTGLGDVVNLGWKLAAVIKHEAKSNLLETYEQERRAVCLNNLRAAQKNADDMMALRKKYDPNKDPEGFAKANAALAKQHTHSAGATMGYAYSDSPLTLLSDAHPYNPLDNAVYHPTPSPGYFLPHYWIDNRSSIYSVLSPNHWTLIISGEVDVIQINKWVEGFKKYHMALQVLQLSDNAFSLKYILVRPDWHVAFSGNHLDQEYLEKCLANLFSE